MRYPSVNSPGVSSAEATSRRSAVVSRIIGSTPDPIRAQTASTTIRSPLRPANRKKSTSLPEHSPSTTTGLGIGCATSKVLFGSTSGTCGTWPTANRIGLDTPESVTTRTG